MQLSLKRTPLALALSLATIGGGVALTQSACPSEGKQTRALRITHRQQLIGGPRALGEVGDWLLENDQVRVIVQDQGFSRGFGVFGGSLIDADLVRPETTPGDSSGGTGMDNFGEMFPAFFLEALEPNEVNNPLYRNCSSDADCAGENRCDTDARACLVDGEVPPEKLPAIEIESDGSDGAAVLVVRGYGNDFLALTQFINETLLNDPRENPTLIFTTRYTLRPGQRYVEVSTTIQNAAFPPAPLSFKGELVPGAQVPTPFGDVVLFGAGNHVFLPHEAGYDLRYRLEDEYASGRFELPALPGLHAEFIASKGPGVSYGILAVPPEDPERNYVYQNRDQYEGGTDHSLMVPFIASAFTGVFQVTPPEELAANDGLPGGDDEFTFKRYFIVGNGDVASISNVVYDILGDQTGTISGRLLEDGTGTPVIGADVIVSAGATKVTQCTTDDSGRFTAKVRPGQYQLRSVAKGRAITAPSDVTVEAGATVRADLRIAQQATVVVSVVEPGVGRVPAKITLVGQYDASFAGQDPRDHLYDLSMGEPIRYTDLEPDDANDPSTLRYIEDFTYTPNGSGTLTVRPGSYTVVVGRGPEYTRTEIPVVLEAGKTKAVAAEIRRVVDTTGYIAADMHLHSIFSLDSFADLDARITSYAGEGVEYAVATDHNYVVDYAPTIAELGLERFINSVVGLELTTIDRGHFNGFPLQLGSGTLDPEGKNARALPFGDLVSAFGEGSSAPHSSTIASQTNGSFAWAGRDPDEIFTDLRALGEHDDSGALKSVVVQVNHPRDSILGYFEQYGLNAETMEAQGVAGIFAPKVEDHPEFRPERFSLDFDAIEVFNGKRFELLNSYRVPEGVTIDPASCCPVTPGEIFREYGAFGCDEEVRDCTCTPADTEAQVANGSCGAVDENGQLRPVAFPGAFEDWLRLLASGKHVVGTANSDSHNPHKEEPGYPRTYLRSPTDNPLDVKTDDLRAAFASGDALMTNGPFVQVDVAGAGMGETATVSAGPVTVNVNVQTAPWVKYQRIRLYTAASVEPAAEQVLSEPESGGEYSFDVDVSADDFVIVEVSGGDNMFPSVFPNEIPPIQFTDVIGAIGGSFGLGGSGNELSPQLTFQTKPFALTNPVYLDVGGDGWTPPRPLPTQAESQKAARPSAVITTLDASSLSPTPISPAVARERARRRWVEKLPLRTRMTLRRMPEYLWPTDDIHDVRRVYWQFLPHGH